MKILHPKIYEEFVLQAKPIDRQIDLTDMITIYLIFFEVWM